MKREKQGAVPYQQVVPVGLGGPGGREALAPIVTFLESQCLRLQMEDDYNCTFIRVEVRGKLDDMWKSVEGLMPKNVSHTYSSASLAVWPKRSHFILCSDSVSSPVTWKRLLICTSEC